MLMTAEAAREMSINNLEQEVKDFFSELIREFAMKGACGFYVVLRENDEGEYKKIFDIIVEKKRDAAIETWLIRDGKYHVKSKITYKDNNHGEIYSIKFDITWNLNC